MFAKCWLKCLNSAAVLTLVEPALKYTFQEPYSIPVRTIFFYEKLLFEEYQLNLFDHHLEQLFLSG
jgi:hypothetical protein